MNMKSLSVSFLTAQYLFNTHRNTEYIAIYRDTVLAGDTQSYLNVMLRVVS